jgi:hypothetical protein
MVEPALESQWVDVLPLPSVYPFARAKRNARCFGALQAPQLCRSLPRPMPAALTLPEKA